MVCVLYRVKDLVALLSYCMILRTVFKETLRPGRGRAALCAAVSAVGSAAGYLLLTPGSEYAFEILDFIATVTALFSAVILFRRPRFWRSFAVLFIYYATVDTLWSFVNAFFHADIVYETAFHLVLSAAVCFAVYKGADHNDLNVMAGAFQEIPIWMLFSLFLFELTSYYKEFGVSKTWYDFLYMVSACGIFVSVLYLAYRVFRLIYTQNAIMKQLNDQLIHESERIDSDEALRRFRHDARNHATVLNAMLEQGEYESAKQYFSSVSGELSRGALRYSTGNPIVDSLLHIKAGASQEQEIGIRFDGAIPKEGIEPKDMCVCFGNLLDNAVEACAALPEGAKKTVRIRSVARNNILVLSFSNPAAVKKKTFSDGLPQTTKKDIRAHGIGLRNVRDTAKKYNGSLHLSIENGQFTAELLLELKETEERRTLV